jgi:hypothetical protein
MNGVLPETAQNPVHSAIFYGGLADSGAAPEFRTAASAIQSPGPGAADSSLPRHCR